MGIGEKTRKLENDSRRFKIQIIRISEIKTRAKRRKEKNESIKRNIQKWRE